MHKQTLCPSAHAIEAALKGEPFPGLVYQRSEFSIAGTCWFCQTLGASLEYTQLTINVAYMLIFIQNPSSLSRVHYLEIPYTIVRSHS